MVHAIVVGLALSSVLLLTMRQDVHRHLLENRIATLRGDRLALQRALEERGYAIAARTDFSRMAPEIQALRLGAASSKQVLALAQLPVAVEAKRTLPRSILQRLTDLGEVRADDPAARVKPTPAPEEKADSGTGAEESSGSGGLW
jgi:hypothetical protein